MAHEVGADTAFVPRQEAVFTYRNDVTVKHAFGTHTFKGTALRKVKPSSLSFVVVRLPCVRMISEA